MPPLLHPSATLKDAVEVALLVRPTGWLVSTGRPATVSTNQFPPTAKPRVRTMELNGMERPISCQPPAMREPSPNAAQAKPLVENSKGARQTSVPTPARSQVTLELSKERLSVAGSVAGRRPRLERDCPAKIGRAAGRERV